MEFSRKAHSKGKLSENEAQAVLSFIRLLPLLVVETPLPSLLTLSPDYSRRLGTIDNSNYNLAQVQIHSLKEKPCRTAELLPKTSDRSSRMRGVTMK